jgi:hypothetical protein
MTGTSIVLTGVSDDDVQTAKSFFIRYGTDVLLEETRYGEVYERRADGPARIHVKGLLVAEEPEFLFSYNITELNAGLRRALNRERANVGRGAYSDRVKDILKACTSVRVAELLTDDLARFASGSMHAELQWKDVAIHACRVLQTMSKVIFVTAWQVGNATVSYAVSDGYRPVVVPNDIAKALSKLTDLNGNPMVDLAAYQREWNDSFTFELVDPADLSAEEREVFDLTDALFEAAELDAEELGVTAVLISETMRLDESGSQVVGVWDGATGQVVIRRDQLEHAWTYLGTLLHELVHASSGYGDATLGFEEALTERMGIIAAVALCDIEYEDEE